MTISHSPTDVHPIGYVLECTGCRNLIDCSADTHEEAHADIGEHLLRQVVVKCAACRAMPNGSPGHLDPAA